jgi:hypothetical protein
VAAGAQQRDDDMVARRDPFDPRADLQDDPRRLVPEHGRQLTTPRAFHEKQIAVADRTGDDPDLHLPGARFGEVELLDREWRPERATDRRLHVGSQLGDVLPVDRAKVAPSQNLGQSGDFRGRSPRAPTSLESSCLLTPSRYAWVRFSA